MLRFLTVLLDFSPRIILVTLEIIKKRVSSLLSFSLSLSLSRDRLLFFIALLLYLLSSFFFFARRKQQARSKSLKFKEE